VFAVLVVVAAAAAAAAASGCDFLKLGVCLCVCVCSSCQVTEIVTFVDWFQKQNAKVLLHQFTKVCFLGLEKNWLHSSHTLFSGHFPSPAGFAGLP